MLLLRDRHARESRAGGGTPVDRGDCEACRRQFARVPLARRAGCGRQRVRRARRFLPCLLYGHLPHAHPRPFALKYPATNALWTTPRAVSYTHLRAHETPEHLVCRLLLEKKK